MSINRNPINFFSGSLGGKAMLEKTIDLIEARLLSCHDAYLNTARKWLMMAADHPKSKDREILLDSGAFSAWSQGHQVELDDLIRVYDELVEKYAEKYKYFWLINLDKIPGEKGRTGTKAEIVEAMRISDKNFEILQKRYGPRVLPVFHQDEPDRRLTEICDQSEYICLSPRNDVKEWSRRNWAQMYHQHKYLKPGTWTHGLATTGDKMMSEVPWRSVDSATWTQVAGYGKVMIYANGKFFMNNVSEHSSSLRHYDDHTDHLTAAEADVLQAALEECEVTYEQCRISYDVRAYVNVYYFLKYLAKNKRKETITYQGNLGIEA